MSAAYPHISESCVGSSPASERSGVAMKNREHKKENILSWGWWVLQSIILLLMYEGGEGKHIILELVLEKPRERERAVRQIGELCNWYFCSFSAQLMLYSWYICFLSTLLALLCNCPATDSFARSFLSFYSQSAVRPRWRVDHPGTCRCRCTTWGWSGCLKKINFPPRYMNQM